MSTAPANNDSVPAVALNGVSLALAGRPVLTDITATIASGACIALLGPNGSGKTTLLRVIARFLRPQSGSVRRFGVTLAAQRGGGQDNADCTAGGVGYVAQRFCLYDELTVAENLSFQAKMRQLVAPAAAQDTALQRFRLQPLAARRASTLSGGERQRLMLAAALLHKPRLLLLDEPTVALDDAGRAELWGLLRGLVAAGTTVILTTHEKDDAVNCDAALRLREGRLE